MGNSTELEKLQVETARLRLEQERRKLAQMQRRQQVVDDLGQGAAAVGGAVARGVKWALSVVITSLLGGALFPVFLLMSMGKNREPLCKAYPDADFLYTIGCAVGENQWRFATFVVAGLVIGAVVGHKTYRGQ